MTLREKRRQKEEERKKVKSVIGVLSEKINEDKNICISILDGAYIGSGKAEMILKSNFPYLRSNVLRITETANCIYIFI